MRITSYGSALDRSLLLCFALFALVLMVFERRGHVESQERRMSAEAPDVDRPSMIRVVGANPAMDRTEQIADLRLNEVNRAAVSTPRAGGKSFIVARALRRLGHPVAAYGFLGGPVGQYLRTECASLGIVDRHTGISGETRINTILVDQRTSQSTVINEPGPVVQAEEIAALTATVDEDLHTGELLILTGSVPRGVGDDLYPTLIALARSRGARAIVDAEGSALRSAIDATPWAVKCNLEEFSGVAPGAPTRVLGDDDMRLLVDAMRTVVDGGVELVIVTLGAEGLVAVTGHHVYTVHAASVRTKNATGSGDTFLAGFASAVAAGQELGRSLCTGAAAASANAAVLVPDIGADADVAGLLARTGLHVRPLGNSELPQPVGPRGVLP